MRSNLKKYTVKDIKTIYEDTARQLATYAWTAIKNRYVSQGLYSEFIGVTKDGRIRFRTESGTTKGLYYFQEVKFVNMEEGLDVIQGKPYMTQRKLIDLLNKGHILVHCTDPSWLYFGFQYLGTVRGYSLEKEYRYPIIRNPYLTGSVCKHLYSVFMYLPLYSSQIYKAFKKQGITGSEGKSVYKVKKDKKAGK